jgi:hypothetical protein
VKSIKDLFQFWTGGSGETAPAAAPGEPAHAEDPRPPRRAGPPKKKAGKVKVSKPIRVSPRAKERAHARERVSAAPAPATVADLAAVAARTLLSLPRGLLDAAAACGDSDDPLAAMTGRMLARATRIGVHAAGWAHGHDVAPKIALGDKKVERRRRKTLATAGATGLDVSRPPVEIEGATTAFTGSQVRVLGGRRVVEEGPASVDAEQRARAIVAAWCAYLRVVEETREQLEIAAASSAAARAAAAAVAAALDAAGVVRFTIPAGAPPDLVRARVTGYAPGGEPGAVVSVERGGLSWSGEILRKADVVVAPVRGES